MAERQLVELDPATSRATVNREGPIPVLEIALDGHALKAIAAALTQLSPHHDLKIIIPKFLGSPLPVQESWVVYIKEAAGSDRSLLAHPTQDEWVGSLLLSTPAMTKLRTEMTAWASGASNRTQLSGDELGRFTYPSNLKLVFSLTDGSP